MSHLYRVPHHRLTEVRSTARVLVGLLAASLALPTSACGGDENDDGTSTGDNTVDAGDNTIGPDAMATNGFSTLVTGTWEKSPGSDSYWCSYKTITEDMYITGFEAMAPLGTHHTVLGIAKNYSGPDKEEACGANTLGEELLYASGVGTSTFALPEGVALKVRAGQTVLLQLHLFNASDATLTGTSGTRVSTIPKSEVVHEAEFLFAGSLSFSIPDSGADYTDGGTCTIGADGTIFTLWPHMHQIGKHMKVDHNGTIIHDDTYSFIEQSMYQITPIEVKQGDKINVECTWNNPVGNGNVGFGDHSDDEMCFSGLYRYPKVGQLFGFCVQ